MIFGVGGDEDWRVRIQSCFRRPPPSPPGRLPRCETNQQTMSLTSFHLIQPIVYLIQPIIHAIHLIHLIQPIIHHSQFVCTQLAQKV